MYYPTKEQIGKMKPIYELIRDECHIHIDMEYEDEDWRSRRILVRPGHYRSEEEHKRQERFEEEIFDKSCNPYGIEFLCAIYIKDKKWIAYPVTCEGIDRLKDYYVGSGDIEESLKHIVAERFGFKENELFCEDI